MKVFLQRAESLPAAPEAVENSFNRRGLVLGRPIGTGLMDRPNLDKGFASV